MTEQHQFISHVTEDKDLIDRLEVDLRAFGLAPWVSRHRSYEFLRGRPLKPPATSGVFVQVLQDVSSALRAGDRRLKRVYLLAEPLSVNPVHAKTDQLLGLHPRPPLQEAQVATICRA